VVMRNLRSQMGQGKSDEHPPYKELISAETVEVVRRRWGRPGDCLHIRQQQWKPRAALMLGDIIISVEHAARQAKERGHTLIDELHNLLETMCAGLRSPTSVASSDASHVPPIRDPTIEAHQVERAERDDDEDGDPRI
ncbi:hypothetical protein Taro_048347, partial [Colocasia esculenta]|nr:hypothetical protein [Colocasia esculenta]